MMCDKSKKIIFAVGDLKIGGSMRVQSVIINHLLKEDYSISVFSMRKVKSFFPLNAKIIYPLSAMTKFQFQRLLIKTGIEKYIFKQPVDMTVPPNEKQVQELIAYCKSESVEKLILVEQWAIVAKELKRALPHTELIAWLHLNVEIYKTFLYGKSYTRLEESYGYCDKVLVLTQWDKTYLEKRGVKNSVVVHNPLTIDAPRRLADLDSKNISFVGRIDCYHKGLDYLVEVAKRLEDGWTIQVAGKGFFYEELKFKRLIRRNHLQNKLRWVGAKTGEALSQHFQESAIFVSTSRFEGFSLVTSEAMSFGLPIVAMKNSGTNEVLAEGRYGVLIERGNIPEFVTHMQEFQASKTLREKYRELSLQRVRHFGLDKIIPLWKEILES
jgi:glycosyltransferase involved in cell wall biosynthesis